MNNGVVVDFYPAEVQRVGSTRAGAEEALERASRLPDQPSLVTAEVIPSKNTEMGKYLSGLSLDDRARYTDQVHDFLVRDPWMQELGITDYDIAPGYGTYKGELNPNLIIATKNDEEAKAVADALGYATQQEAVPIINRVGEGPVGVNAVTPAGAGPEILQDIHTSLGLDATRTKLDQLDVVHFDGMPDDEFINALDDFFKGIRADARQYRAGGSYNPTEHLWASGDNAALRSDKRATYSRLRDRVQEHNQRFSKQKGYADPRALGVIAALSAVIGISEEAESAYAQGYRGGQGPLRSFATPETMAVAALTSAAGAEFQQRRQAKQPMWDNLRQDLLKTLSGGAGAAITALESLEIPMRGYHGIAATLGSLAEGKGLEDAIMRGGTVARQDLGRTGQDLGRYVADKTGNPYAAALTDAVTNVVSPF
jgi:hypothetical protein